MDMSGFKPGNMQKVKEILKEKKKGVSRKQSVFKAFKFLRALCSDKKVNRREIYERTGLRENRYADTSGEEGKRMVSE